MAQEAYDSWQTRGLDERRPLSPLEDVVFQQGLLAALPKGGIHVCAGTHGIPVVRKIKEAGIKLEL